MDTPTIMAISAGLGSVAGGAASLVTSWITQRTQSKRASSERILHERVALYNEFLTVASRLAVDALGQSLERPDQLAALYGVLSRVRLISGDAVLAEAEACCRQIVERYARPNVTSDQIRTAIQADDFDILKAFSSSCRRELRAVNSPS
jgi:hypothetical protein